jgi:transposase
VDSAYIDAGLLVESQRDHGVSLEGPVRGMANQYARAKPSFPLTDTIKAAEILAN